MNARAKAFVSRAVKRVAAAGDRLHRAPDGLVVLLYHQVGGPRPGAVNLDPVVFADQMAELAARAEVVHLDRAVSALVDGPIPSAHRRQLAITFDDGTADFVDIALPILVEHGIPVTLYVATAWVDEGRSFWDDGTVLSWSALAEATSTGLVTIGSHGHTHRLLDRLDPTEIADELARSTGLIEHNLEVSPAHFAYPKAVAPSADAAAAVRERFVSAALAGTRPNVYGDTDPFALARSPIQVADGMRWFRAKVLGGMRLEDEVRQMVNRRRYVGSDS